MPPPILFSPRFFFRHPCGVPFRTCDLQQIGCDNEDCEHGEWFHYHCVGLEMVVSFLEMGTLVDEQYGVIVGGSTYCRAVERAIFDQTCLVGVVLGNATGSKTARFLALPWLHRGR